MSNTQTMPTIPVSFLHCFSTKQSDDQRKNSQLGLLKAFREKKLGTKI